VRDVWSAVWSQPLSFKLLNFYLFIEYVRPQTVWSSLDVIPWGQTALLLTLVAAVAEGRLTNRTLTVADGALAVFSGVLVLSSVTAVYPADAMNGWMLFFSWVLVYTLFTCIVTTEQRFFITMLAFLLYSFKMSQHGTRTWVGGGFSFQAWGASGAPGWFQNSGEFGIQMCIFLPLSVEFILAFRRNWGRWTKWFFYLLPVTAVVSMIASSSRGALVGGAAVALWWISRFKRRGRALLISAAVLAATWVLVPAEQKARFASAGEDETSVTRLERWQEGIRIANEYPLLGIGYDNWERYTRQGLSHNIFIEAWSELGYVGLAAFLGLIIVTFLLNRRTRRICRGYADGSFLRHMAFGLDGALIGYVTSGFFVTVLYYPYFWINLAMTVALYTCALHKARGTIPVLMRRRRGARTFARS